MSVVTLSSSFEEELILNLFHLNKRLLHFCGLIPSAEIASVPWKLKLYRIYTFITLSAILCGLGTTFISIFQHWEESERASESAFVCISFLLVFLGSIYILLNWERLERLMRSAEHEILSNIQRTYIQHLHEAEKFSKHLTWFLLISCTSLVVLRGYVPLIIYYVGNQMCGAEGHSRESLHLLYDMWLPFSTHNMSFFLIAYAIQLVIQCVSVTHNVSVITYFFTIFIYTSTRQKILCSAFQDIDMFVPLFKELDCKCFTSELNAIDNSTKNIHTRHDRSGVVKAYISDLQKSALQYKNVLLSNEIEAIDSIEEISSIETELLEITSVSDSIANFTNVLNSEDEKILDEPDEIYYSKENSFTKHEVSNEERTYISEMRKFAVQSKDRPVSNKEEKEEISSIDSRVLDFMTISDSEDKHGYDLELPLDYISESDVTEVAVANVPSDVYNTFGKHGNRQQIQYKSKEMENVGNKRFLPIQNAIERNFVIDMFPVIECSKRITTVEEYFKECIREHQDLLRFVDNLNGLISLWVLSYSWLEHSTVYLSIYCIVQNFHNVRSVSKFLCGLIGELIRIYPLCYFGENIISKSLEVSDTIYSSRWYNCSAEFKRLVHISLMRAQKPTLLKSGMFGYLSNETFSVLLATAYIFFLILFCLRM